MRRLAGQLESVRAAMPLGIAGRVCGLSGLTMEAADLPVGVGAVCRIHGRSGRTSTAQVIGFRDERTLLMPLDGAEEVARGDVIEQVTAGARVGCSPRLLGRVLGGMGRPIDGSPAPRLVEWRPIEARGVAALERRPINRPMATGIGAIDGLHTCGMGQRMGIFSGPGVGKSMLLASIARNSEADVSVLALIGERGREVKQFLEEALGSGGLGRCVVVVSTSDEPAPMRVRAAKVAATIAEYFRDQGKNVLLLMDSLTRMCQAQRQIGLAAGEPAATKGFGPSVFALLPAILERAGRTAAGSITGFYTVLAEGDDFNEPLSDAVKATTDGHLWLSRSLASRGHWPAIDVVRSISRVRDDVADEVHRRCARRVLGLLAVYEEIEELVNVGAYVAGVNAEHDLAKEARPRIMEYLKQEGPGSRTMEETRTGLLELAGWVEERGERLGAWAAVKGAGKTEDPHPRPSPGVPGEGERRGP